MEEPITTTTAEPIQTEPTEPVKMEPQKVESTTEPTKPEPTEPVKAEPTKSEPKSDSDRITELEGKIYAMGKGVKSDYADDIVILATAEIKRGNFKSMEKALDKVIEKYPSLVKEKEVKITTSARTSNDGAEKLSGVEAAFMAKNPGLKV